MRKRQWFKSLVLVVLLFGCSPGVTESGTDSDASLLKTAGELAQRTIIVDTHVDLPYRLGMKDEDISQRTESGNFDYPRAREGGLNAPFVAIYVPAEYQEAGGAKEYADRLIDLVEGLEQRWPGKFRIARSIADIERDFERGLISFPMGMENGAPIERSLANVGHFHSRGVRYITLTHGRANQISDSSYDPERPWGGLSPFGREVVFEMNRVGMMIDISHVSDAAFYQVMELSKAPVIASHSSCRHFTPGWERNMDDGMIQLLARKGGVIQINFGSSFINNDYRLVFEGMMEAANKFAEERGLEQSSPELDRFRRDYLKEHPVEYADVGEVADHIDHVVRLAGIDHVGIGSDFDGVGDSLPVGLKDVSDYPNLILELLKRGYSEEQIQKICSGNIFRVWSQVEKVASDLGKEG